MVKRQHKFLCIVLCLALVLTAVMVGSFSTFAASGDTIYVRLNNGWSQVYAYMWTGSGETKNAEWPGVKMTATSESGVYTYKVTGDWNNIIFNNGSGGSGNQTDDMSYSGNNGQIYDLSTGSWSAYSGGTGGDVTTPVTTPVQPTTTGGTSSNGTTVYLKNTAGWSNPVCYMWNSGTDTNAGWPGVAMTKVDDEVWMYTASKTFANCIFSNSGNSQTADLTARDGYIFDYNANSWDVYDVSDLQVKSVSADPASDIYTGMEVTLSANASNKNGKTVYYMFSVNGKALGDFSSANTASWTPTAAGTYTVTFDFKDDAGNENSRTLSLSVASDANVVKPIIKSVYPAHLGYIKLNADATVTVNAGGGVTGTNLLFYKYIVTDPSGGKNTPYYTLNSTYTFRPTKAGTWTVEVFVQGSDNTTVSKTYSYTASNDAPTTPVIVEPTTVPSTTTPVVSPTTAPVVQPTTVPDTGVIFGDANGDGDVDVKDVTYIQKHCAGYKDSQTIVLAAADIDHNGKMSVVDATQLQYIINE